MGKSGIEIKMKITRKDFLKKIGLGSFFLIFGSLTSKINSNAMVNDNIKTEIPEDILLNKLHPIGDVITSYTCDTEEKVKKSYGGSNWVQIKGKFLFGAGDTVTLYNDSGAATNTFISPGTTGGNSGSTLTVNTMPKHNHGISYNNLSLNTGTPFSSYYGNVTKNGNWGNGTSMGSFGIQIQDNGGSKPHNNMPPIKEYIFGEGFRNMKKKISRTEFIKRIGLGTAAAVAGAFTTKITSFAMVNDNLSSSETENSIEKITEAMKDIAFSVGSIIHNSNCKTMAQVINIYGGNEWIKHTGYILRGAEDGVIENKTSSDGGQDTITPSGTNSGGAVLDHKLTINEMPSHKHPMGVNVGMVYNPTSAFVINDNSFDGIAGCDNLAMGNNTKEISNAQKERIATNAGGNAAHNHGFTQPTFKGNAHTNIPKYKNVYIWERTK